MRVCLGGGYKQKRMKSVKNVMPEVSIHPRLNSLRLPPDSQYLRIYLQDARQLRATGSRIEGPNNMHGYEPPHQVIILVPMFLDVVLLDSVVAVLALGAAVLALDVALLDTAVVALVLDVVLLDTVVAALVLDVALLDAHLVAVLPP
jgi:hypothetical protein